MTREMFNKVAEARFSAIVGFNVECSMMNCSDGIFVSVIAEGHKVNELSVLPNIDGTIDYDAELDETFAFVKLS